MKNQKRTVKFLKKNKGNVQKKAFKKRKRTQSGGAPHEAEEEETQPLQFRDAVDSDGDDSGELDGAEFAGNDASEDEKQEQQQQRKAKKNSAVEKHKNELEALRQKDPDFYNFLQQHDQALLQFGDEDSDAGSDGQLDDEDLDVDDEEGAEDDEQADESASKASKNKKKDAKKAVAAQARASRSEIIVDQEMFQDLLERAERESSLLSLKKVLSIFRSGCASQVDDDKKSRYTISDPEVYEFVMANTITKAYLAFYRHLDLSPEKLASTDNLRDLSKHKKWRQMELLVLSFFKSALYLISKTADKELKAFIIGSLEVYIPLLGPMPRLTKTVMKTMLLIWSTIPADATADVDAEQNLRAHAFLRVRQMAIVLPPPTLEDALKLAYVAFARTAKTFNEHTSSSINFMTECLVELYGLDMGTAYQNAFVYIRQLALHLRNAMVKKTPEAIRQLTSWQFLNCVRVWTRLLCKYPEKDALFPLVYPFCQVVIGVVGIAQSPRLIPIRLHFISCLQQVAAGAEVFVPAASKLLDILDTPDFTVKPLKSTDVPPNLYFTSRLGADASKKQPVQDVLIQETLEHMQHDVEIYRYNVAFPEYLFVILRRLKAFIKRVKVGKWRGLAKALVEQITTMATWVERQRSNLSVAPKDIKEFETLKPKDAQPAIIRLSSMLQRHAAKAQALKSTQTIKINPFQDAGDDYEDEDEEGSEEDQAVEDEDEEQGDGHFDDEDEEGNDEDEKEEEEPKTQKQQQKKRSQAAAKQQSNAKATKRPAKKARGRAITDAEVLDAPDEVRQVSGADLAWSDDDEL